MLLNFTIYAKIFPTKETQEGFKVMTTVSSPLSFLKEVRSEMKKVSWPTRQEAIRLTGIVIGISLIVAVFIGILDFLFTNLMTFILK